MAVGYSYSFTLGWTTLSELWNGTNWSVVPTPRPGLGVNPQLSGVSCVTADACTAVGWYSAHRYRGFSKTLAESWNGTSWSVVPSPSPGPGVDEPALEGVSCASAAACTTTGSYEIVTHEDLHPKALVETGTATG
jgi:hypothetical protein